MVAKNGAFQQLLRLQQFAAAGATMATPSWLSHLTPVTSHLRHFKAVLRELGASAVAGRGPLHAQVRLHTQHAQHAQHTVRSCLLAACWRAHCTPGNTSSTAHAARGQKPRAGNTCCWLDHSTYVKSRLLATLAVSSPCCFVAMHAAVSSCGCVLLLPCHHPLAPT